MNSQVDFSSGVFINDKVEIEGVGAIPITLTSDHLQKRALYHEALLLHRGIKNPDQVTIADAISLFYVVTLLLGVYDPEVQAEIVESDYKTLSADVAEKAVSLARDYHSAAANAAANESMLITVFDELFTLKRDEQKRVVVTIREGYNLPKVKEDYFDDTEINDERTMEGLPPLFPRNPVVPAEQKLSHIATLLDAHPSLMIRVNSYFNTNVTEEVRQAIIKQEASKTDEAGFHPDGTGGDLPPTNDADDQESDAGDSGTTA